MRSQTLFTTIFWVKLFIGTTIVVAAIDGKNKHDQHVPDHGNAAATITIALQFHAGAAQQWSSAEQINVSLACLQRQELLMGVDHSAWPECTYSANDKWECAPFRVFEAPDPESGHVGGALVHQCPNKEYQVFVRRKTLLHDDSIDYYTYRRIEDGAHVEVDFTEGPGFRHDKTALVSINIAGDHGYYDVQLKCAGAMEQLLKNPEGKTSIRCSKLSKDGCRFIVMEVNAHGDGLVHKCPGGQYEVDVDVQNYKEHNKPNKRRHIVSTVKIPDGESITIVDDGIEDANKKQNGGLLGKMFNAKQINGD